VYGKIIRRILERPASSHKYDYGHVLILGGSPGMVGAPLLAGKAALRTGAGLVTIAAAPDVTDKLEKRVEEIMTLSLPADASDASDVIRTFSEERKVSVLVVGPGLAGNPENTALVVGLIKTLELPAVIDGGGLAALRNRLDTLEAAASKAIILTPHTGEFQRLIDKPLPEGRSALKPLAADFVRIRHVTLVLKGQPTYVARPDGSVYENTTGNPGLATAGTGDVLSGMIAGIIAQGIAPGQSAETAVYLHGLAGDIAAASKTQPGMIAGDVIDSIPEALRRGGGL
jgi:hydroxyethylthiazole kinase-like uncharacterized protein yjeF